MLTKNLWNRWRSGYNLRMFTARVETKKEAARKKISIQEAARDLRYAFFLTKKAELGADVVATAHNANDNAETLLMNFFRGTGIDGIAGIPLHRNGAAIVRPLLFATRQEIVAYAHERKLKFREDSSNLSDKYSRNFLRRKVIPLLEKRVNPSLVKSLSNSAAIFRDCAEFLREHVQRAWPLVVSESDGEILFLKDELRMQHPYMRQMIVHDAFLEETLSRPSNESPSCFRFSTLKKVLVSIVETDGEQKTSRPILLSAGGVPPPIFRMFWKKEGMVANDFFSLSVKKMQKRSQ